MVVTAPARNSRALRHSSTPHRMHPALPRRLLLLAAIPLLLASFLPPLAAEQLAASALPDLPPFVCDDRERSEHVSLASRLASRNTTGCCFRMVSVESGEPQEPLHALAKPSSALGNGDGATIRVRGTLGDATMGHEERHAFCASAHAAAAEFLGWANADCEQSQHMAVALHERPWVRDLEALNSAQHEVLHPLILGIGVQKSSTTSQHLALANLQEAMQSPLLAPPTAKELHYLDRPHEPSHKGREIRRYADELNIDESLQTRHQSNLSETLWPPRQLLPEQMPTLHWDISPSYILFPNAAARAKLIVPHAGVVLVVREPVTRYLSSYFHMIHRHTKMLMLRKGPRMSLDDAAQRFPDVERWLSMPAQVRLYEAFSQGTNPTEAQTSLKLHCVNGDEQVTKEDENLLLIVRGLYAVQLKHWLKFFDADQVLVVTMEHAVSNMQSFALQMVDHALNTWEARFGSIYGVKDYISSALHGVHGIVDNHGARNSEASGEGTKHANAATKSWGDMSPAERYVFGKLHNNTAASIKSALTDLVYLYEPWNKDFVELVQTSGVKVVGNVTQELDLCHNTSHKLAMHLFGDSPCEEWLKSTVNGRRTKPRIE